MRLLPRLMHSPGRRRVATLWLLLALLLGPAAGPVRADDYQDRRAESGVRIFRALLAADLDLEHKTDDNGRLQVLFIYRDDRRRAEALARQFGGDGAAASIRGLALAPEPAAGANLGAAGRRPPAGIFLAQPADDATLQAIVRYAVANRVIVFSPFEGDVERGVTSGLSVEAQVRPYLNAATLRDSNITLKEFFLKVAKVTR